LVRASTFLSIKKVTCMLDIQVGKTPSRTTPCKQQ